MVRTTRFPRSLIFAIVPLLAGALPGGIPPFSGVAFGQAANADRPAQTTFGDTLVVVRDTLKADTIPPPEPAVTLPGVMRSAAGDAISPILVDSVRVEVLRSPIQISTAPFAISFLYNDMMRRGRSNSSIDEALQGLPGVQVQNRFNDAVGERISIRGFGARSQFGVRGIRILVDGIPATLPDGQSTLDHLDLGTLGRVEALRGPGSALYGNASGGVLDFRSVEPPDSPIRQEFRTVHGDFGMRRNQVTTSGRIRDGGYMISLARYEWGGYRLDPSSVSGGTYGSALRDQVNGYVFVPLAGGDLRVTVNGIEMAAENPGSLDATQIFQGARIASPGNITQRAGKDVSQGQIGVAWIGPVRDRILEVSTYGVRRRLSSPTTADFIDLDRTAMGLRALLRTEARSEIGSLWWAMGFEADLQMDERRTFQNVEGLRGDQSLDQSERVFGGAVFIQALLPIAPILDVLTGLRYDRIRFAASDRMAGLHRPLDGPNDRTLDSASPSFGIHADFHRAFGAYVNLSTAFETPTTSEMSTREDGSGGFNIDLEPQVGITTELGGRGWLGSSAAWELTFFHSVIYNELVPYEVEDRPDRRYFRNSGRSQRDGWEATLQLSPESLVSLRLVLSTNDARFREYEVDGIDYRGKKVPGLAPRRFEGMLRLGPPEWFVELRAEASSPIPGNDANDPEAESPGYVVGDIRAGGNEVAIAGLRISPFVGVTNVFDVRYNTAVTANALGGRYFEPGPGRGFYVGSAISIQK